MKSAELTLGRTFSVTFEHGKDFFTELKEFCAVNDVKQGYIPFFIAGMSEVELVGTCEKIEDKNMLQSGQKCIWRTLRLLARVHWPGI